MCTVHVKLKSLSNHVYLSHYLITTASTLPNPILAGAPAWLHLPVAAR